MKQRGATLIEILVAIALVALMAGGAYGGLGLVGRARLRESTMFVASAIHLAYVHANASSRPTRLVFDLEKRSIEMEDTDGRFYVQQDRTGGAAGATELEKEALEAGEAIVEGAHPPRPDFRKVQRSELAPLSAARERDDQKNGKVLPKGVTFRQIEVAHEDEPVTSERVYLYFWPGGRTERAAIQVALGEGETVRSEDTMTLSVQPLTGKVTIDNGFVEMQRPRRDEVEE